MKIGLCGTISCGKTTLAKELAKQDQFKDYTVITERSQYLRDLGISLNTDSNIFGQFVFAAERAHELMNVNLITDRTIYDVSTFTLSSKSISWEHKEKLVEAFLTLRNEYDVVVYVSPEGVEIEDNGVRSIDPEYRTKIDKVIVMMLEKYPPQKLIKVSGTTEDRIKAILEQIS